MTWCSRMPVTVFRGVQSFRSCTLPSDATTRTSLESYTLAVLQEPSSSKDIASNSRVMTPDSGRTISGVLRMLDSIPELLTHSTPALPFEKYMPTPSEAVEHVR